MIASFAIIPDDLGVPYIAGGDFNMKPAHLRQTGILQKSTSTMMIPSRSTCITRSWTAGSTIDFFITAVGIDSLLTEPKVDDGATLPTHRPVQTTMEIMYDPCLLHQARHPTQTPNIQSS